MNRNHYEGRHSGEGRRPARRRGHFNARLTAIVLATVALLALAIGGTIAWLNDKTDPVENTFDYAHVTCEVTESFDAATGVKSNVNVKNTSNTYAFLRVKLVAYRTNAAGQHIGGTATIPTFTPGAGWVEYNGYYYYTQPVSPDEQNNKPATDLISSITLGGSYADADGGYTALDVMAEAIQSTPEQAVKDAWGFGLSTDGSLAVPQN
mgnify:CR=1 FL=1